MRKRTSSAISDAETAVDARATRSQPDIPAVKPPIFRAHVALAVATSMLFFGLLVDALALHTISRESASGHSTADHSLARWFAPALCSAFGLLLTGVALASGFSAWRLRSDRLWLAKHGTRVVAGPWQLERSSLYQTDNLPSTRPYLVVASWRNPLDGAVYRFASDPILRDPLPYMTGRTQVEVLIDPQAPHRHWMDLGFLPASPGAGKKTVQAESKIKAGRLQG